MRINIFTWMARAMLARGRTSIFPFTGVGGRKGVDVGDNIAHSVRFRRSAACSLSGARITPPTDNTKYTLSVVFKRGTLGVDQALAAAWSTTTQDEFYFDSSDRLAINIAGVARLLSNQVFRDTLAHGHIVIVFDGANATNSLKLRAYYNGSEITSWATDARSGLVGTSSWVNDTTPGTRFIGTDRSATDPFDGVISRVDFVDGQVLTPSSFGRFSQQTGAWVNRNYTGTYGVNGYSLRFNSVSSASDFGVDSSGNGNTFTVNNVSATPGATYDWLIDTPTNNFCILSVIDRAYGGASEMAVLDGGLTAVQTGNSTNINQSVRGTFGVSGGKWYYEGVITTYNSGIGSSIGVVEVSEASVGAGYANSFSYYAGNGNKQAGSGATSSYGAGYVAGDVIGCAFDLDGGTITMYKNGVSQGTMFTGLTGTYSPFVSDGFGIGLSITWALNFGQKPFSFTPPTGYKAICTANMPAPAIANGRKFFDAITHTGTSAIRAITGMLFQPDLMWIKNRNGSNPSAVQDSIRGSTKWLITNSTTGEGNSASNGVQSFNSDGFTLGPDALGEWNSAGLIYVEWLWKKSAKAGIDIVTFLQTSTSAINVNHSLGVTPECIILKDRTAGDWSVFHKSLANMTSAIQLLSTSVIPGALATPVNAPTSTTFSSSASTVNNGNNGIAYLFASVPGFSKIGGYTGSGSADGPFIWCGFRPKFILLKRVDVANDWIVNDTARDPVNPVQANVFPDLNSAEASFGHLDILSNGFKIRVSTADCNANGGSYIYLSFAEVPFQYANAR